MQAGWALGLATRGGVLVASFSCVPSDAPWMALELLPVPRLSPRCVFQPAGGRRSLQEGVQAAHLHSGGRQSEQKPAGWSWNPAAVQGRIGEP